MLRDSTSFRAVNLTRVSRGSVFSGCRSAEISARNPLATPRPPEILSYSGFRNFTTFLQTVGWKLVFGLNLLDRSTEDGSWNATNSMRLIDLVANDPALRELVVGWELGNEPDLYNRSMLIVEGGQIAKDTAMLRSLVPPEHFLLGWDVAVPWLQNLWPEILHAYRDLPADTVHASTLHHYYRKGTDSAMEAVLNPDVLDELRSFYENATEIATAENFAPPLWLGETSSFSGGGSAGVSDRFAAGFIWLDKLGLAAKLGVPMVFRQTLRSNEDSLPPMSYGLLSSNILPHADYWNSLLHKRLMGQRVLDLELSVEAKPGSAAVDARKVRAYAHCTSIVPSVTLPLGTVHPGAVTMLFLNLETDQAVTLDVAPSLLGMLGSSRIDFRLQASTIGATWQDTLASWDVKLNGVTLLSMCNGSIPLITGYTVAADSPLTLPQISMFFMVFPEAQLPECGYVAEEKRSEEIAVE